MITTTVAIVEQESIYRETKCLTKILSTKQNFDGITDSLHVCMLALAHQPL